MLARAGAVLPTPTVDPDRVRAAARAILQRPEFRPRRRTWLQAVGHWLATQLGKLLAALFGGSGGFGSQLWSVAVLVVLAVAAVLIIRVAIKGWERGGSRRREPPGFDVHGDEPPRSAADWRAEAASHAAAGRYREALRCRYRALVADLAGRGVVVEIPGHTGGEYLADLETAAPVAAPAFGDATDLFEQVWYGGRPAGAGDQSDFDNLADEVLAGAGSGAP